MLKQIADLVKHYGQDTVVNNPEIPNEANKDVLAEATHTISGGFQNMLAGGGLQNIISLFTGAKKNQTQKSGGLGGLLKNSMIPMMVGHFISKLINKFKMKPESASRVSNQLIPNVMNDMVHRTTDTSPENDSFDLDDLISSFTGGKSSSNGNQKGFSFQNLLNQFTGKKEEGDQSNGFNLQDMVGKVTHSAQEQQAQTSGGGLMNLIKGLL